MQFEITAGELDEVTKAFGEMLDPRQLGAGHRRAVQRATKAGQVEGARVLRHQSNLPIKITKRRVRTYFKGNEADGESKGKVYLGLNSVAAHALGNPRPYGTKRLPNGRRMSKGIAVGKRRFAGHFQVKRWGGVYRRTGEDRFPLELAKVEIDEAGAAAAHAASRRARKILMDALRHEYKFRLRKQTLHGYRRP